MLFRSGAVPFREIRQSVRRYSWKPSSHRPTRSAACLTSIEYSVPELISRRRKDDGNEIKKCRFFPPINNVPFLWPVRVFDESRLLSIGRSEFLVRYLPSSPEDRRPRYERRLRTRLAIRPTISAPDDSSKGNEADESQRMTRRAASNMQGERAVIGMGCESGSSDLVS